MAEKTSAAATGFVVRLHPVTGEDISIECFDFTTENEALEAITRAVSMGQGLMLNRARYGQERSQSAVVVNMANVVSARVSKATDTDDQATGQYM